MTSITYLVRRFGNTLIVLLGVATATFFLARISGDPVDQLLPIGSTIEQREMMREQLGLNQPLVLQYTDFLRNVATLNFGDSFRYGGSTLELYKSRFPATLELVTASVLLSVALGLFLGVLAAAFHGRLLDRLIMWLAMVGQAIPGFYLGLMLMLFFSVRWGLLPTGGRGTWEQLIMPTIVLSSYYIALLTRMTRAACLDTIGQDFVRTARAKGAHERTVLFRHVLRAALIPVVTLLGIQIGAMFSGAVIVETVFSWPGIGRLALDAIYARDFPVVQTVVILSSIIFVAVNFLVDVAYLFIDPRISYG